MIKVLWFSNTPALGINYLSSKEKIKGTGGWLAALNDLVENEVQLNVAFQYPYEVEHFVYRKTNYFPIYSGNILLNVVVNRLNLRIRKAGLLKDYIKIIENVKPDIIHIHGTENRFIEVINIVDIPVVVSIQGNLTVINHKYLSGLGTKYLKYKSYRSIKSFILGIKSYKQIKKELEKSAEFEQKHMRKIEHIIGRTDWDYRISRVLSPLSNYYVGGEILREAFYNERWDNPYSKGKCILFTTAGENYYKGLETIFYSLYLLQNLEIDVEWRIAGVSRNSNIMSICKRKLGKYFPINGYKLLGSIDEEKLVIELLSTNFYITASHIENSPNSLSEAMILGLPCIASYAGGIGSMIKNDFDGILIQDGDPWVLSGAIIQLMKDKVKQNSISSNARISALKRHDKKVITKQYLNIYNSIIHNK